jgi:hypothetical protein
MRRLAILLPVLAACGREPEPLIGLWREGASWRYRCTDLLRDKTWVERWKVTKAVAGKELELQGEDVLDMVTLEPKSQRIHMVGGDTWLKGYPDPVRRETVVEAGCEFSCVVHRVVDDFAWYDLRYPRLIVKEERQDASGNVIFRRELIDFDDG